MMCSGVVISYIRPTLMTTKLLHAKQEYLGRGRQQWTTRKQDGMKLQHHANMSHMTRPVHPPSNSSI